MDIAIFTPTHYIGTMMDLCRHVAASSRDELYRGRACPTHL